MKLTKLQRHTAYMLLLAIVQTERQMVCDAFYNLTGIDLDQDYRFSNFKKYLPELWKNRDNNMDERSAVLWWKHEDRIEALKKSIKETA